MERSLGIELKLVPNIEGAADITEALEEITERLERLKDVGGIDLAGLQGLNAELGKMVEPADRASKNVRRVRNSAQSISEVAAGAVDGINKISSALTGVDRAAESTVGGLDKAAQASERAAQSAKKVGANLGDVAREAANSASVVDSLGAAFIGLAGDMAKAGIDSVFKKIIEQATDATLEVIRLQRAFEGIPTQKTVRISVIREEEAARRRASAIDVPFESSIVGGALPTNPQRLALPYDSSTGMGPIAQPANGFTGEVRMLPGAHYYSPEPPPIPPQIALPGATAYQEWANQSTFIPGAEYEGLDARQAYAKYRQRMGDQAQDSFDAQQFGRTYTQGGQYDNTASFGESDDAIPMAGQTGGGGGRRGGGRGGSGGGFGFNMGLPPDGFGDQLIANTKIVTNNMGTWGKQTQRLGNDTFWGGFYALTTANMLGAPLMGMVKNMSDIDDLLAQAKEAFQHGGGKPENFEKLVKGLEKNVGAVGGDYRESIVSLYPLLSSLPTEAKLDLNKQQDQEVFLGIQKQLQQLHLADSSSAKPIDTYDLARYVAATAKNLGTNMNSPEALEKAYSEAINFAVQLKNKTGSQGFEALNAIRQVGNSAVQAGVDGKELQGIIGILADYKIIGSQAGNQTKRILSRQAMDPAALKKLQDEVVQITGGKENLSIYNEDGSSKGVFDLLAQISTFEKNYLKKGDKDDKAVRGRIAGTVSGLYAANALGALLNFVQSSGAETPEEIKKALSAYTENLLSKMPEGYKNKIDPSTGKQFTAVAASADIRAQASPVKTGEQKLNTELSSTMRTTFEAMTPDIVMVLKVLTELVKGFDALPMPVKKGAVELAALGAAGLALVGVVGIIAGGLTSILGTIAILTGAESAAAVATSFLSTAFGAGSVALRLFSVAFLGVPIVGWIAGIITAGALLYSAWTGDWGGIREKTAAAINAIQGFFGGLGAKFSDFVKSFGFDAQHIPESIGFMLGRAIYLGAEFVQNFPVILAEGFTRVVAFIIAKGPDFLNAAANLLDHLIDGFFTGIPKVIAAVGNILNSFANAVNGWISNAVELGARVIGGFVQGITGQNQAVYASGEQGGQMFAKGQADGIRKGTPAVRDAHQGLADMMYHSEPKTGPLVGTEASGRTGGQMFTHGMAEGVKDGTGEIVESFQAIHDLIMGAGGAKTKKPKKGRAPASDALIDTKGEAVAAIEATAQAIEDAIEAHGHVIHKKWIDLFNPKTNETTTVYGLPFAYHEAVKQNSPAHDQSFQNAEAYADKEYNKMRVNPESVSVDQIKGLITGVRKFETTAASEEVKRKIEDFAVRIELASQTAQRKIEAAFKRLASPISEAEKSLDGYIKKITGDTGFENRFNTIGSRYDQKLSNQKEMQKDPDDASKSELNSQRSTEITESRELTTVLQEEEAERDKIASKIAQLSALLGTLNQNNAQQKALFDSTTAALAGYRNDLTQVNDTLENQQVKITSVNRAIDDYGKKIDEAKEKTSALTELLQNSFAKALTAAGDAVAKNVEGGLDTTFDHLLGRRTVSSSNAFQQGLTEFVKTFVNTTSQSVIESMFDALGQQFGLTGSDKVGGGKGQSGSGSFSDIFAGIFGGNKSGPKDSTQVSVEEKQTADNTTAIQKNTKDLLDEVKAQDQKDDSDSDSDSGSSSGSATPAGKTLGIPGLAGGNPLVNGLISALGGSASGYAGYGAGSTPVPANEDSSSYTGEFGADSSPGAGSGLSNLTQNLQGIFGKVSTGIGGLTTAIGGFQTGGLGGAIGAGSGIMSLISTIAPSFGPWGLAIAGAGAVVAGLLHHDNPAEMPDKYNTQEYGTDVADLTGKQAGANGTTFYENPQLQQQLGGLGEIQYIEEQLAAGRPAGMSSSEYQAYIAEFGESATGSGTLNFEKDIANQYVTGATGATGEVKNYQQLQSDAANFIQADEEAKQLQQQQQADANRLASSFTSLAINGAAGFIMPSGGMQSQGGTGAGSLRQGSAAVTVSLLPGAMLNPSNTVNPNTASSSSTVSPQITIHLLEGANLHGDDLEGQIDKILPQILQAINQGNYNNLRYRGNYQSVTT